jgi:hypothetical protein
MLVLVRHPDLKHDFVGFWIGNFGEQAAERQRIQDSGSVQSSGGNMSRVDEGDIVGVGVIASCEIVARLQLAGRDGKRDS